MSPRFCLVLFAALLLALEPCWPPAPAVQKVDLEASLSIQGLCGLAPVSSRQPSLCGQAPLAGLYAADGVPVNRGFFAPAPTAKWVPHSRFSRPGILFSLDARLFAAPPSFKAEPISPPPRA
ncbi:MAG TPA: hypothetical protein VMU88_09160 [bacterium]|nr:hypothetical protein [bacterium]